MDNIFPHSRRTIKNTDSSSTEANDNAFPIENEDSLSIENDAYFITSEQTLKFRLYQPGRCNLFCKCCCHKKRQTRSPNFLDKIIGSFFVGYTGLPLLSQTCNVPECRKQSNLEARIFYSFPAWIVKRKIMMNISFHQPEGFELCLETPRVVPDNAGIFSTVQWGTLDQLRYFLQSGRKASVLDTSYSNNKTRSEPLS